MVVVVVRREERQVHKDGSQSRGRGVGVATGWRGIEFVKATGAVIETTGRDGKQVIKCFHAETLFV